MRTILIDVDTQHDFCDPRGALYVNGADALCADYARFVELAVRRPGVSILGSVDAHAFDAWEFAGASDAGPGGERPGFPPHCVKGTAGFLKVPGTLAPRARFIPCVPIAGEQLATMVAAHAPQQIILEKEVYSLFANPNADQVLELVVASDEPRFVVFGVALDYCVRAAALGLVDWLARTGRRGEVRLVVDATAAVNADAGRAAVEECRARGVLVSSRTEVLSLLEMEV